MQWQAQVKIFQTMLVRFERSGLCNASVFSMSTYNVSRLVLCFSVGVRFYRQHKTSRESVSSVREHFFSYHLKSIALEDAKLLRSKAILSFFSSFFSLVFLSLLSFS